MNEMLQKQESVKQEEILCLIFLTDIFPWLSVIHKQRKDGFIMKSKTSMMCKGASIAVLVLAAILAFIENKFVEKLQLVVAGLLIALVFFSISSVIDKVMKTMREQKRIYDSIDALSEKINIMLGLDKTTVAIENLKAETAPVYADAKKPLIKSEEDLTWNCPDCDNIELSVNTVCTKCGYDRNEH